MSRYYYPQSIGFLLGATVGAICGILFMSHKKIKTITDIMDSRFLPSFSKSNSKLLDIDEDGKTHRILRKAETVLLRRTSRIVLVIELSTDSHNYTAVIRTAECLGIQHIWVVKPPIPISADMDEILLSGVTTAGKNCRTTYKKFKSSKEWKADAEESDVHIAFARQAANWVTIRNFSSSAEVRLYVYNSC